MTQIRIKILPHAHDLELPAYGTPLSSGVDLRAALSAPLTLHPGQRALVPCGVCLDIPEHLEGQVRPRSGLALKHGLTVANTPGTIDADYRGEICVILINLGQEDFVIERGLRIAQLVFAPVQRISWQVVDDFDTLPTLRQAAGFGSTGVR